MSIKPSTQHGTSSPRFFALTPERLEAITQHGLTRADILVWTLVELRARPRQPVPFTLEGIADELGLGVSSVRRAVRRLLEVRVLVGLFEGNRYRLAPAAGAFENLPRVEGSTDATLAAGEGLVDAADEPTLPPVEGGDPDTLPQVAGFDPQKPCQKVTSAASHSSSMSEKKESLLACALSQELVSNWGMYPQVALRMVATYGEDRVRQVLEWGNHLKATKKLRSRGWAYQALVREWHAPDGFHAALHKAQEGTPAQQQGAAGPAPEERERIVRWHLARRDESLREHGRKLAAQWGIVV